MAGNAYLPASALTIYRQQAAASLPDTATVVRPIKTQTATGGQSIAWTDQPATLACRVDEKRPAQETQADGTVRSVTRFAVSLPFDGDVQPTDRLRVVRTSDGFTQTFEVNGTDTGKGDALFLTATCTRLQ